MASSAPALSESSPLISNAEATAVSSVGASTTHALSKFVEANTGLLLVAASQAFFASMNVAVKILHNIDPPVPALELVAVRMVITYVCCMAYMLVQRVPDPFIGPRGVRLLLVFRGISGFFGLFGVYYSLRYLSLSETTVLTFLTPLCTAAAGSLFLRESFRRGEALAGLCSLVGVVFIARPEFLFGAESYSPPVLDGTGHPPAVVEKGTPTQRLVAVGVALLGVLGATGAYTTIRAIGKRAHPLHLMASFSGQSVVAATAGMFFTHSRVVIPTRLEWLGLLVMIGLFGFVAQVLLTMGLQRETAGRGAMAIYVQIIFATVLEQVFFHTTLPLLSVCGAVIIMSSAIYIALTKGRETSGNASERI